MGRHAHCTLRELHSAAAGCLICATPSSFLLDRLAALHLPVQPAFARAVPPPCSALLYCLLQCLVPHHCCHRSLASACASACTKLLSTHLPSPSHPAASLARFRIACPTSHLPAPDVLWSRTPTPAACSSALLSSPCSTFCHGPRGPGGGRWRNPLRSIRRHLHGLPAQHGRHGPQQ